MAGIAQARARRQETEQRRASGSDKQQKANGKTLLLSCLCFADIVFGCDRGSDTSKSQHLPPNLPLQDAGSRGCPGLRRRMRSRKPSGRFPSCLTRMYISGEGPNLLLHIALIKQWKASGQTDGTAKNWDSAAIETQTVLSVPEQAAAFHLELAVPALRVGGRPLPST